MRTPSILISGSSVAGPTLAHWLNAAGWHTTVVERFAQLRDSGQNIDIRGAARDVVRRMGIDDTLRRHTTGEEGTQFLDRTGRVVGAWPRSETGADGATAELEILRGELSRIIHATTEPHTEYLFDDQITGLDDTGDRVDVTFRRAPARSFDLVVIAEGLTSRTRRMVFPDARITDLGLYTAYLTIPRTGEDNDWWRWYHADRQRQITLRPDNLGTIRAVLSFMTDVRGLDQLDRPAQTSVLRRTFAGSGPAAARVLDQLDSAPYYFDAVGQIRLPSWHRGRIALVGDAAYCASPLSGMGTSLALVGAYVLATELARSCDHETAYQRYETRMRPYVTKAQKLPPGVPRLAFPRTRTGVRALHTAIGLATTPLLQRLSRTSRFTSPPADNITLPDFPAPT
ncbi:FAD-dependent monooxygenase [Streptomyces sp. BYX5S]